MAADRQGFAVQDQTGADESAVDKAKAVAELMLEVAQCFFKIRALGQKAELVTSWGGGAFGFMRSIAVLGPLTVPHIAQMRPTSRQRMQRLADELASKGLVDFIDNPRHQRSKLVQLTPEGRAQYNDLEARLLTLASSFGFGVSEPDIRAAIKVVRQLSDEANAALGAGAVATSGALVLPKSD